MLSSADSRRGHRVTGAPSDRRVTGAPPRRLTITAVAVLFLAALAAVAACPPAQARSVQRGIFDNGWVYAQPTQQEAILKSMAGKLHVQAVRIDLLWYRAEPARGEFDVSYLSTIRSAVDAARERGLKVMVDLYGTPEWASDESLWDSPPSGAKRGYHPRYPPAVDRLDDWQASVESLVGMFKGKVRWWECWNEPNIWGYLYPQKTRTDKQFSARRYVAMLKRFYKAARAADDKAVVLGGVTAPVGMNDANRTSPLRFARQIRSLGAARYFHAYSHHPYMPAAGWPMPGPERPSRFGDYCVTLGNIQTLLRLFPGKPFHLSEYGYPTKRSSAWGYAFITEKLQADYLKRAYRFAARFKQVRSLHWFLWKDINAPGTDLDAYFGLVRPNGTRKPAWYAYARLR